MILKQHGNTMTQFRLEALDRRLSPLHPMKNVVQRDYKNMKSGVRGEREVDYPLSFLDVEKYLILHNLRLRDKQGFFQIDTLILSESFFLLLEVKNWYGTLLFDENGQVIRIGDDYVEEGFPNPVPQAKMQLHRLHKWLQNHDIFTIPLELLVVISFLSTIIKSTSPTTNFIPKEVIHNNQLFFTFEELGRKYSTSLLKIGQLRNLAERLMKVHTPPSKDILVKYNVSKDELIKGVFCPKCFALPMIRKKRQWFCTNCSHKSVDAHLAALNDYKMLIGNNISNQETREFLQLTSPNVAKWLLQKNFKFVGNTKARVYEI
ncbi:nuclease-related domain-containing protein [Virgibacillus ndiopensis]|uniref:nuclease-related domain-containing protein n=1 Tax=Virgibacillus ndiopensis TaxID=2004408 RepID=UPI000C08C066|nr:nuclease-related domain-containing protein [Virgibacillus ndiopensis]